MVGGTSLGRVLVGSARYFLERGLKPSRYLHPRTDKHPPQRDIYLQGRRHCTAPLRTAS